MTEDDTVVTQETSILGAGEVMEGDVEQGLVEEDEGQVIKRGGGGVYRVIKREGHRELVPLC